MRIRPLTYLVACICIVHTASFAGDGPRAVKGVLDLRGYDFRMEGPVGLKGEFEFYWNQMINPGLEGDSGIRTYIRVPGSWYRLKDTYPGITRYGFATYRVVLLLPPAVDELSLEIVDVFSASTYYLDGRNIDYLGFPGVNKYQTVIKYSRPLVTGRVEPPEAELLIRVANFDHRKSGIAGGITLGLARQMQQQRDKDLFRGHFLIGAFLIIGIYFLGLYLIRPEDYRLYFSMICMLMALRVAIVYQLPIFDSLNLSGLAFARLDLLNTYFFIPFFTLMIRSIFPIEFPGWAFRWIMWISALFIAVVAVTPVSLFSYTFPAFFFFFLFVSGILLYVLVLAWNRGRSHSPVFTLGLVIVFFGALNDILYELDVIHTDYIVQYAMFIYLLAYAYIFADKSNQLQREAENLAGEISQVKENLEDLVEERTTELQAVSRELEQQKAKLESSNKELLEAVNARNRLFSIIGHDVRAPIGYTRQALEMILENPGMPEAERNDLLGMMANSSEITYNLLDNLLVWGRSQTGRLKTNPVRFQLKGLIDESLELVKIGLREKRLKVEVFVSETHYVEADRDQLYIVIRNLLSNAMKFTPQNGRIVISTRTRNGEVVVSVRDTGIGIPAGIRDKILDTATHMSTDGTKGEKGSGLGLKICNEIVQTNQGWMRIESESGTGTTILIGIKAADETPASKG